MLRQKPQTETLAHIIDQSDTQIAYANLTSSFHHGKYLETLIEFTRARITADTAALVWVITGNSAISGLCITTDTSKEKRS
jgi:hypothetical protein